MVLSRKDGGEMAYEEFTKTWGNLRVTSGEPVCDHRCTIEISGPSNDVKVDCSSGHLYRPGRYHPQDSRLPERISDGCYKITFDGDNKHVIKYRNDADSSLPTGSWTADDSPPTGAGGAGGH